MVVIANKLKTMEASVFLLKKQTQHGLPPPSMPANLAAELYTDFIILPHLQARKNPMIATNQEGP